MRIAARSLSERFEILEKLGQGGMGVVYRAKDRTLDRFVALKFLAARHGETHYRGFDEARAIASLSHPNIATIYEVFEGREGPVLVLEYLPGETLRFRMAGKLQAAEILRYGIEIAEGLAYAHQRRLVHGDVKPENVMFTEDRHIKITDFGLARPFCPMTSYASTITMSSRISGTPRYMAPECFEGWPADCRTDIFALGVVLEEMAERKAMPEAFHHVIVRATARERTQRFASMGDLAAALRQLEEAPESCRYGAPTVLVVEDDECLRSTLEMSLSDEGYRVVSAATGREGIRLAREKKPGVVLLDVMMPGLNGFDVCRELRSSGFRGSIVMVTGRTEEVDRVVGLEIGADDYLTKPFGHRELVARIRARLRHGYNGCGCSGFTTFESHQFLTQSAPKRG
jgi:CheY-like chemotaxis protein